MIITKKYLPRRTVLRGLGVTLALPFLDSMIPALATNSQLKAHSVRRLGVVYVPMGMNMAQWTPVKEGALELSPILQPLASFKDRLLVLSGLDHKTADLNDGGPHPRCQTTWLTGVAAKPSEAADIRAGVSMDQLAASDLGRETQLRSLELAIEDVEFVGTCSLGYSCTYTNTMVWRSPTTPLPMENNPRAVFERLFGAGDSTDPKERAGLIQRQRSILDSVTAQLTHFNKGLGSSDRFKLAEYLESVREVERRIQMSEEHDTHELSVVEKPMGIPAIFEEHVKLMFDLLVLAYQADLTRVATYLMCREASVRSYPEIGISEAHHPLSHHSYRPEKLAQQALLNVFHTNLFAYFVDKMGSTSDGDGSLLDHTLLLYGSGMSDSHLHIPLDLPTLVIGGESVGISGGRHIRYPKGTPQTNLYLTLLDKLGVKVENLGDSTGELNLLSEI